MGGRERLGVEDRGQDDGRAQGPPESHLAERQSEGLLSGEAKKERRESNNTCSWSHSPGLEGQGQGVGRAACPWLVSTRCLLLLPVSPHFTCGHPSSKCVCVLIFFFSFLISSCIFILIE